MGPDRSPPCTSLADWSRCLPRRFLFHSSNTAEHLKYCAISNWCNHCQLESMRREIFAENSELHSPVTIGHTVTEETFYPYIFLLILLSARCSYFAIMTPITFEILCVAIYVGLYLLLVAVTEVVTTTYIKYGETPSWTRRPPPDC